MAPPAQPVAHPGAGTGSRWGRAQEWASHHLIVMAAGLFAVALVVTLLSSRGSFVADSRFEQFWAPWKGVQDHFSAWASNQGGLGLPVEDFWLGPALILGVLRGLGASPAVAERIWHSLLLASAGAGAVAVLRLFRPRIGVAHVVAGALYTFNPYTVTFLIHSFLFLNYALAPWLIVAFIRGVREGRPWKWAAVFALVVFAAGNLDVPGLVYASALVVPSAAYVVHVERSARWRDVAGWVLRAAVLVAGVSAASVHVLLLARASLTQRLVSTEDPTALHVTSSWAESWRGLGFWLSYFSGPRGPSRPGESVFYTNPAVVLATFAAPVGALAAMWRTRWRPRVLFASLMLLSLVLMVGAYPVDGASPIGAFIRRAQRDVVALSSLRNSYKAGSGLLLGTAVLVGIGVAALLPRFRRHGRWATTGVVAVVVVLGATAAAPFWTGKLYTQNRTMEEVPSYWKEAFAWLNAQPDDRRALVVPGSSVTSYRWGRLSDDMFTTFLRQPHIRRSPFLTSGKEAANAIDVINRYLLDGRYRPGTLGPLARRLGVGLLVIRNDLDWELMDSARPSQLQSLRQDPELVRVKTFGRRGENVRAPGESSLATFYEAGLPPVEVYAVRGGATARVEARPPLLVSGDAEGLLPLARFGVLDGLGPVRYTAGLAPEVTADLLDKGARVVVTDTNRRRAGAASATGDSLTPTLPAGVGGNVVSLFGTTASQSVATYSDARTIEASGYGTAFQGFQPWLRPANAFDGNPRTSWQVGGLGDPVGSWVRAELHEPAVVDRVRLVAPPIPIFGRTVSEAELRLSDGTEVPVRMQGGVGTATFPARTTESIEVRITDVAGRGLGTVGLSEIELPGVDGAEVIRTPSDLVDAALADPRLSEAIGRAGVTYQFVRQTGHYPQDEELVLRRSFSTAGDSEDGVSGVLRVSFDTPDQLLDDLLGGPVGAFASSRYAGDPINRGRLAADGRLETAWHASPKQDETLAVRFPERDVSFVELRVAFDERHSPIRRVTVAVGGQEHEVEIAPPAACTGVSTPQQVVNVGCLGTGRLALPGRVRASALSIRVADVQTRLTELATGRPMAVAEVSVSGGALPYSDAAPSAPVSDRCRTGVLSIDGRDVPVALRGTTEDLLRGRPLPYTGCTPVSLGEGSHLLTTSPDLLVDETVVQPATAPPLVAAAPGATVTRLIDEPTHVRLRVVAPEGGTLLTGISADPQWRARVGGSPLPRVSADMQEAVQLPGPGTHVVDLRYGRQRTYEVAQAVTLLSLGCCLVLALRHRS